MTELERSELKHTVATIKRWLSLVEEALDQRVSSGAGIAVQPVSPALSPSVPAPLLPLEAAVENADASGMDAAEPKGEPVEVAAVGKRVGVLAREKEGRPSVDVYLGRREEAGKKRLVVLWTAEIRRGDETLSLVEAEAFPMRREAKERAVLWLKSEEKRAWATSLRDGQTVVTAVASPPSVASGVQTEKTEASACPVCDKPLFFVEVEGGYFCRNDHGPYGVVANANAPGLKTASGVLMPEGAERAETLLTVVLEGREVVRQDPETEKWRVAQADALQPGDLVYVRRADTRTAVTFNGPGYEDASVLRVKSVRAPELFVGAIEE